jgi:hypothetical protein
MSDLLELDHLVYATPDLDATVADLTERLGVAPRPGGRHPGWGTRNAILPLGGRCYLEIVGPDEGQPDTAGRRVLDVDRIERPHMAWWAVRPFLMPLTCGEFETAGFVPGPVIEGRREIDGGRDLVWQITDPRVRLLDGVLPLVIDWEGAAHPGEDRSGVTLKELRLEHPEHARLSPVFQDLGLRPVHPGDAPAIVAVFDTPRGAIELR